MRLITFRGDDAMSTTRTRCRPRNSGSVVDPGGVGRELARPDDGWITRAWGWERQRERESHSDRDKERGREIGEREGGRE